MVEAVPFGTAADILIKLGSSTFRELGLVYGVNKEMKKLENTLSTIKAVLLDAEEKQEKSHLVQDWIRKLSEVVYEADDLLDAFETKARQHENHQVREFFSKTLAFRYKMGRKLRETRERLDEIAGDISKFNFRDRSLTISDIGIEMNNKREETHSFMVESAVIGRKREKEEMVKFLIFPPSTQENVSVTAIVGIGGLGKTTLAKMLYNDDRVVNYFEIKMWVWAYGSFDLYSVAEKILRSIATNELEDSEFYYQRIVLQKQFLMEELQILLRKKLDGKRYLLVLDDVWNVKRESWLQLNDLLKGGAKGSKIVVTTRSTKVTALMDVDSPFVLQDLSEEESWTLFKQLAFKDGREEEHPELVPIGRRIVKKCRGVPLAIRTLGSMMRYKPNEREWISIQNTEIWELPKEENDVLKILKLSYDHMPIYLKQCFSYCALFPKGNEVEKKMLVELWIAQGYIHLPGKERNLEEIGDLYFKELIERSLFQEVKKDANGNVISCHMHDLIHDLSRAVAGSECSICSVDVGDISERVHHVSFSCYLPSSWEVPIALLKAKKTRTFILPLQDQAYRISSHNTIISNLRRLRVLDLHNLRIDELSNSIGKLTHLRYLDLSGNVSMTALPASISNLQNLQTLKLNRCYRLEQLPRDIGKMISLRHLEITGCRKLNHMPPGLGKLVSLQTLPLFILGRKALFSGVSGGIDELSGLNCLKGVLHVAHLEHVDNVTIDSRSSNLSSKQYLESLKLIWSRDDDSESNEDHMVLEGLQPHQNLKVLHIAGYCGVQFPNWLMNNAASSLPSLVELTIEGCLRCQHLPPLDQLPSLKFLKLYSLSCLEHINNSYSSPSCSLVGGGREPLFFPSLKELTLYDLPLLKEWQTCSDQDGTTTMPKQQQLSFPSLTKLTIVDAPNLMSMPMLPLVEELLMDTVSEKLLQSMLMTAASESQTSSSSLARLKFLIIKSCNDLVSFPEDRINNLTSLELLKIIDCGNFTSLPHNLHCEYVLSN
ncbi:putative P-loop containing nucleoside triphosphate hydrolase, leucine-rich repeat domain, L [Rosa chinensis]|uniref:Putative P-loop containing nucleoside triphosphate hydrolase, leucine-rich repeat domain, L n=1 Tax=Rosa chinensis TaxID=74649 RepID=A0A2P6QXU2_ROSCH|nr:putative disease resistance protein RGA3 [Rosa chinensis]PRQ38991.1 putative P-loop containing nucleoside triphosphate hydrolase, leucine-rich repeat domain, L [Rosa chinensis]